MGEIKKEKDKMRSEFETLLVTKYLAKKEKENKRINPITHNTVCKVIYLLKISFARDVLPCPLQTLISAIITDDMPGRSKMPKNENIVMESSERPYSWMESDLRTIIAEKKEANFVSIPSNVKINVPWAIERVVEC